MNSLDPLRYEILQAKEIATRAHRDQTRWDGSPYIEHPRAVAAVLPLWLEPAGWLHDVVEDTTISISDLLSEGISSKTCEIVYCLTKREGENYAAFISRTLTVPGARTVKIADIQHNMSTLDPIKKENLWTKYALALMVLTETSL